MSLDNRDQRVDQLLQGIYRLCVNTDDCSSCPFYVTKCTFGEPRPRSWFDEETIEIKAETDPTPVEETETDNGQRLFEICLYLLQVRLQKRISSLLNSDDQVSRVREKKSNESG